MGVAQDVRPFSRLVLAAPKRLGVTLLRPPAQFAVVLVQPFVVTKVGRLEARALLEPLSLQTSRHALALAREGLGVALKIEDGASRALGPAILEVLLPSP